MKQTVWRCPKCGHTVLLPPRSPCCCAAPPGPLRCPGCGELHEERVRVVQWNDFSEYD